MTNHIIGDIYHDRKYVYINDTPTRNIALIGLAVLGIVDRIKTPPKFEKAKAILINHFKGKNHRKTSERLNILKQISQLEGPFDANDILFAFDDRGYSISRATVYNAINLFLQIGILKRNHNPQHPEKSRRYELNLTYESK